ncbi:MAG: polysaccharide pyruvyl transferase family protein [Dorea sp.]|nr:polysaccharide pyruvyl transferase family protein [Dorea sp.]
MKVGTINFHRSQNYGALMVTYSLLTYLKKMGIAARAIDYFPEHHTSMYPLRNEAYDKFIDKYLKPFSSVEEEYDLIIYGADTIWEYYKGFGYDSTYWGSGNLKAKRRITYSASGTLKNFSEQSDELFRKHLDSFDAISVREDVLAEYLKNFTSKTIIHTCDPTFLLTENDYFKVMSERLISGEYAVIYNRQLGTKLFEAAETVRQKTGLRTVVLKGDGCLYSSDGERLRADIGPSEFLSLVKYSSYVLAASFHAVAFSIIFKKQFHTIMKTGSERVESLLRKLELGDRRIQHSQEISFKENIDYARLYSLHEYVENSKKYLDRAINI